MSCQDFFIDAFDVLSPRGNQDFGQPGEHARAQLLPWPSVVAGAIRSAVLAGAGYADSRAIKALLDESHAIGKALAIPGSKPDNDAFQLGVLCLARFCSTSHSAAPFIPLPADVVVNGAQAPESVTRVIPGELPAGVLSSSSSNSLPVLRKATPGKAMSGLYLNSEGWNSYIAGGDLHPSQLCHSDELAARRHDVGIGMDSKMRVVKKGLLYTAERIEFKHGEERRLGFAVRVHNAKEHINDNTLLRLGGDGHAALLNKATVQWSSPPLEVIARRKRFCLVLMSPALFTEGYAPPSLTGERWLGKGVSARLCASISARSETISGWDMQKNHPKPARRFVPTGAVYWFDDLQGDPQKLLEEFHQGAWTDPLAHSEHRITEGFNQIQIAAWHGDKH